jgi:hypothetical protein
VAEVERYVAGQGAIGDYLAQIFKAYQDDHFGWSKEIWDVVALAYLINADWVPSQIVASPMIAQRVGDRVVQRHPRTWTQEMLSWSFDYGRHPIRCAYYVDRDPIFRDLFAKLAQWARGEIDAAAG